MTRDQLLARVSDILRRSGVEDRGELQDALEIHTLQGDAWLVSCMHQGPPCDPSFLVGCPRGIAILTARGEATEKVLWRHAIIGKSQAPVFTDGGTPGVTPWAANFSQPQVNGPSEDPKGPS